MRLFIDTSAFLALEDENDKEHGEALGYRERLRREETGFRAVYTSNYVLDEILTLLRLKLGHRAAVVLGENLKRSKILRTLRVTPQIEDQAWNIFKKYDDKDFSFTDCTSFALMEREAISVAFAFDEHFQQYGFQMVP
ncbi:PIN domain-containing protein [Candidatus Bathyarchaeota archaeon]|nr:PIN domain-containing protein [Candidatus Bathyarchaeota archaeon]NIU81794.1 PIN domain-containing protein [Candidatus Bathyarchaeota archaeon]NIV68433.1 PIN domain-containing protein [Candidatus Bathyarchaeota archaeon]NIW34932.1 PIN domain-containing protein [Candidatus Bathyarchaeota archaeon]